MVMAAPLLIAAAPVTDIQVQLTGAAGPLPPALARRMTASVTTISDHIFVGKDTEEISARKDAYEQAAGDIVNRVLYGYTVDHLSLEVGPVSTLYVTLRPYGATVEQVQVEMDYGNLPPLARQYVAEDIKNVKLQIDQILLGAPVDSLDWADAVTQSIIRSRLEDELPEFIPQVEVQGGVQTKVKVYLVPQGDIVRRTQTEIQSDTLPSTVFWTTKRYYNGYLAGFEGVPVAFLARHEKEILADITTSLEKSQAHKTFGVVMTPELHIGSNTELDIQANSDRYVIRGEGYLDMGHKDNTVGFRLHTGYNLGRGNELYLETEFYPDNYEWRFYPSYAYHLNENTSFGYQYNIKDHDSRLWVRQHFGSRWHIRAQRDLREKRNEFGLGYDIHSNLTLEYIFDNDDNWLRVIGHV